MIALALAGCAGPGVSSRCGYDWLGTTVCEARFHHRGKPATAAAYAYARDGRIVPLYEIETSSVLAPLGIIAGAAPAL